MPEGSPLASESLVQSIQPQGLNLEDRTTRFGEETIDLLQKLPTSLKWRSLVDHLLRSSTTVGAHYLEAEAASSKLELKSKLILCLTRSKETRHWLRMIAKAEPAAREQAGKLWRESQELIFIFSSLITQLKT